MIPEGSLEWCCSLPSLQLLRLCSEYAGPWIVVLQRDCPDKPH